jgi:hypothetical protein|tara:strand:- start:3361 stop:3615 length:255 start_codon:yes stop_codon:yes gene_type:complete
MKAKYVKAAAADHSSGNVTVTNYDAIYVGGAGNLKVDFIGGGTVTLENMVAGQIYPFEVTQIYNTGSTAYSTMKTVVLDSDTTY